MAGNSIGQLFTLTTFGESHGVALGGVIDGMPSNFALDFKAIQAELDRRKPATSKFTSPRQESDQVEFLSGIFEGKTTGTSIGFIIRNEDQRSRDYSEIQAKFRPNHGDFTYQHKYGIRDYRGGGRASARETTIRVVAGAIAKQYLTQMLGVEIHAFLSQVGNVQGDFDLANPANLAQLDFNYINQNPFFAPTAKLAEQYAEVINQVRKEGNSVGGRIQIVATNMPIGLGEPVFDKLNADLAHALMSINAVKAVEIGDGWKVSSQFGGQSRDEITPEGFVSNHAGGILAGISNGEPLLASISLKPTSSIRIPAQTIDLNHQTCEISTHGRHDPCVAIRAVPIAEAMVAIVLMDHWLRFKAQCK